MKKTIIIGGGLGGLSCAINLAVNGYRVTLIEKEAELGGKLTREVHGDYSFDLGPSTITMMSAFDEVFKAAGRKREDYLTVYPINPMTRNIFADGSIVDLSSNIEQMEEQISRYSKEDARQYRSFLQESNRLYTISEQEFLNRLLVRKRDRFNYNLIKGFIGIQPFTSIQNLLEEYFQHPNTLAMFGRYATYVGSSPYQTPAVFSMMAHLEGSLGIYGIKGGTYYIVEAFEKLANEVGVTIKKNEQVKKICVSNKKVTGIETDHGFYEADQVVANGDALAIYRELIEENDRPSMTNKEIDRIEPSLSGFVMLLGVKKQFSLLKHHTVFFPEDYQREFIDLFDQKRAVEDPTIYICYSGYSDSELCSKGKSNLFVLVNAPAQTKHVHWDELKDNYASRIKTKLENKGLINLVDSVEIQKLSTPDNLQKRTGAYKGAIYGMSSNSFRQAFFKVNNKAKDIGGLWFVGGSTHPGGGTPIVTKSGQLVAKAIIDS
ncbi:phytoene desaturase family protein [Cytobacillus sp. FJAT-54145]|uniref:4,4'-diaponeurosporene oxygenase n=1 Tax=Cytobacillus spartinae TaxID=3299023 RepID=A0ABW6K982_9BACI